jgi:cytochrome c553
MKKVALALILAATSLAMADGKALYAKCAGCHGADGKTKALGKSDPIAGLAADKVVEELKGYKAGTLNKHGMGGVMKGQANMSEEDMKAVAEYIATLGK